MDAITVSNVFKKYKNGVPALNDLSLNVDRGDIFTLLGPNGAGKSTLISILTTFLRPDSGEITVLGNDLRTDPYQIRKLIACVAQRTSIDSFMSLKDNMIFQSHLYGIPRDEAISRMNDLISIFNLKRYTELPVASYSGGVKRRLDIAMAMVARPSILFLDEPTTGMDIQSRQSLWNMLRQIQEYYGTTIFLTTHYLEEADMLSNNICIMKEGHQIIQGSPEVLRNVLHQNRIEISFPLESNITSFYPQLIETYSTYKWSCINNTIICYGNDRLDINSITQFIITHHVVFNGIQIVSPSLEDVFLTLTADNYQEVSM